MIEHVERHAGEGGFDLKLGTHVESVGQEDGGWTVRTGAGDVNARQVVVATGYEHRPVIPDWEGREDFEGPLLHAAEYRNPDRFHGRAVLVVGPGSSGMEIAQDLADNGVHNRVWLSARTPPNIVMREGPGGVPGDLIATALLHLPEDMADAFARLGRRMDVGDLSEHGLPIPEEGVFSRLRRRGVAPAIVDEDVIEAIREGRIEVVGGVEALDATGVALADGTRVEPDAVICATGYRRGLEPLVGHLGVLDERGMPRARGEDPAAEGLRFIGYVPRPGPIGYMAKQAKRAARAIDRELRRA